MAVSLAIPIKSLESSDCRRGWNICGHRSCNSINRGFVASQLSLSSSYARQAFLDHPFVETDSLLGDCVPTEHLFHAPASGFSEAPASLRVLKQSMNA